MKALILLTTLKKDSRSNTETLVEFLIPYLKAEKIETEIVKTVVHTVLPGTYTNMGEEDEWPEIYKKLVAADMIIFATPIWWGTHSSETQKVIERLDEVHDIVMSGKASPLADKVVGIVITGDSDGSQHIIGTISNFINGIGMFVPPYGTLSVQAEEQAKESNTPKEDLMKKYEMEYADTAQTMAKQLARFASLLS
ncbi:hypothetical protein GCM10023231_21140 [Olivibacter ginsenosidimutans]|uniref:NADPH-dependent FMN reductase-like domain-containing protein n=1 Tax=Olivibacter ginsenosidimutans TaxID=1176537 RepID=A0ABP9BCN4_9SPHI